ncbi:CHAD domain-containing protein [Paraburkholderia phosphatilytica]|uniref:CHAD domain-containing protein n=1 Tax=Paraburkholderia phosphatilytica TaxID=2282883 RepID=UPI000E4B0E64|nr:CHAD domain-containing protein [Paraburkholderia phosphatilytica]
MTREDEATPAQDSAESQFSQYARPLIDEAVGQAAALASSTDAEVLHQMRVALRRLRSLLWAYRPLLDRGFDDQQRALFKRLAAAAGETRDWDILIELLKHAPESAALDIAALEAERAKALQRSRELLAGRDVKPMLRAALQTANRALNTAHERTPLERFARRRFASADRSLKRRMRRAAHAKRGDYASFHDVRKAAKKVRYLLEFFEPLLAKKQRKALKPLKKVQKRLGELNDVVASEALLQHNLGVFPDAQSGGTVLAILGKARKRKMRAAAKLM